MSTANPEDFTLPALREDLQLLRGPAAVDGSLSWTIFDPVRNKYFRIGWSAFQMLSRWSVGKANKLIDRVSTETTYKPAELDLKRLIVFLQSNSLTLEPAGGDSRAYLSQYLATKPHWLVWLISHYLFFRIPLFKADRFLRRTLPYIEFIFYKPFRVTVVTCGLLGLYLAIRQWETFAGTFFYFFTLKGAVFYFIALVFIKILHELGHAYTAIRYGCRVPVIGIALLVMFPVLYTDTTDAWRLISRRQRIFVGMAGMITEFYVALFSTFLWSFLPDGMLRSIAFIFASTSWITSIAINTNIFMRFDGYYILSDILGVENLQERSFALGKWKLRELLFKLGRPAPERFPEHTQRNLIFYAWGVWIYRAILFIGIALLVYHFFFKLLGIILFAVEIIWFILLPMGKEFRVWWEMRERIWQNGRLPAIIVAIVVVLFLFFVPMRTRIDIPAILQASNRTAVHALAPGKILSVSMREKQQVAEGDILLMLESPQLENDIDNTLKELRLIELKTKRRVASPEDLANTQVLLQQIQELESKLSGLRNLREKQTIRAPISGIVVDKAVNLHEGRWVNETLPLATIIQPGKSEIVGIVDGNNLDRIAVNQSAVFYPDEAELDEIEAGVVEIVETNIAHLESPYFASLYGGEIAVREDQKQKLVPEESSYRVRLLPVGVVPVPLQDKVIRGDVYIYGKPSSFANRVYNLVASVLIRESGF